MTVINHKSISGVTSITAPAGSDNLFTVHTNDTTERFRIDASGHQNISGIITASNFKTGTTNVHNVGVEAAGINVLGADTPIGTGATIYDAGGAVFTGVVTSTSFIGENSSGAANLTLKTTSNSFNSLILDSNRAANTQFAIIDGRWNGNVVNRIQFVSGSDGTNKDDGYMVFHTRTSGESLYERLRIDSDGDLIHKSNDKTLSLVATQNQSDAGTKIAFFGANRYDTDEEFAAIKGGLVSNSGGSGKQNGYLKFIVGSDSHTHVMAQSGNVGIGTDNPTQKLDVHGNIYVRQPAGTEAKIQINEATTSNALNIKQTATEALIQTTASQPLNIRAQAGSGSNSYLAFWTRDDERLRITSTGLVGILTATPEARLDVYDTSGLGIISRSASTQATDTNKALKVRNNSSTDTFNVSYKGQGYFAGKVGINETNPGTHLHVEQDNAHSGTYYLNSDAAILVDNKNSAGTARSVIKLEHDAALVYGAGSQSLIISDRQNERLRIDSNGRLKVGDNVRPASDANEGAQLRVTGFPLTRTQYYSPAGQYFGSFGYTDDSITKSWISVDSAYNKTSAVSSGIFLSAFHSDANGSACGHTIKNTRTDAGGLVFSTVHAASSTGTAATEAVALRIDSSGRVRTDNGTQVSDFDVTRSHSTITDVMLVKGNAGNGFIRFQDNDSTCNWTMGVDDGSGIGANGFIWYDRINAAYRLSIDNDGDLRVWNGKLGVGIDPTEKLHVQQNHNGHTRAVIQNNWGANATAQLKLIAPTDEFQLIKYASGAAAINLSNNSTIYASIGGAERLKIRGDSTGQTTHIVNTPSPGGNGVPSQYVTQVYAMSGNYTNFRVTVTATSWHSFFLKFYVSGYSGDAAYRWVTGYCNNGFGTIRHVHSYDGGDFGSGSITHISGQSWRYDLSVNSNSVTHPVMHVELSLGGNGNILGNGAVVCAIT